MSDMEHKGVKIWLEHGNFVAKVGPERLVATTFAGIKKKVEKANPMEPFDAFVSSYSDDTVDFNEVQIVGTKGNGRQGYNNRLQWVTRTDGRYDNVIRKTPNSEFLIARIRFLDQAIAKIRKRLENTRDELANQLVYEKPAQGADAPTTPGFGETFTCNLCDDPECDGVHPG